MPYTTEKERKCIRYLAKEMSREDRMIFQIELLLDEELNDSYNELKRAWELYPTQNFTPQRQSQKINKTRRLKTLVPLATILIVLGLGLFYYFQPSQNQLSTFSARDGERKKVVLPDSSVVVLNSGSSVSYPIDFENGREVSLTGEAYFQIEKNIEKPFTVHSEELQVRVLGTAFSVNNYSGIQKISLKQGKVEVVLTENKDKITLDPGEQLLWDVQNKEVNKREFDMETELSWADNILLFKNIPLGEALPKINRYYGVNFKIEDLNIRKRHITGSFENQSLDEFISSLEYIANITIVKQENNQFLIRSLHHD